MFLPDPIANMECTASVFTWAFVLAVYFNIWDTEFEQLFRVEGEEIRSMAKISLLTEKNHPTAFQKKNILLI